MSQYTIDANCRSLSNLTQSNGFWCDQTECGGFDKNFMFSSFWPEPYSHYQLNPIPIINWSSLTSICFLYQHSQLLSSLPSSRLDKVKSPFSQLVVFYMKRWRYIWCHRKKMPTTFLPCYLKNPFDLKFWVSWRVKALQSQLFTLWRAHLNNLKCLPPLR